MIYTRQRSSTIDSILLLSFLGMVHGSRGSRHQEWIDPVTASISTRTSCKRENQNFGPAKDIASIIPGMEQCVGFFQSTNNPVFDPTDSNHSVAAVPDDKFRNIN